MKKDTFKNLLIGVLLLVIVCGMVCLHFKTQSQSLKLPDKKSELTVSARELKPQDVELSKSFIGRVAAVRSVNVLPYLSGYVAQIPADSGQIVQQGETLIVLRQEEYKAALTSAYAKMLSASADLQNTRSQYKRLQKAGAKAVSQTELDNAKTAYLNARAMLKQAEANFETAQVNLNYTVIRAPFSGVLGNINVSVGDFASPSMSQPLVRLVQYNPARVIFSVTDKEFLQNRDLFADKVKIILSDGEVYPFSGKVIYTENVLEKSTNTLAVYAEFANPDKLLLPNAYVKILLEHVYKNVLLLPKDAAQIKSDGYYVYVLKNKIVAEKQIQVIAEQGDNYVIENNFAGELLITQKVEDQWLGQKAEVEQSLAKED